ncbi:MAG: EAL domain-containing protein [Spirochaetes bacterium]|nr:MAG: EAL domain-containing protein [Spirochaetota bacterium]
MGVTSSRFQEVMREGSVRTVFQPIISVKKNSIIGFEALSRFAARGGETISPLEMFAEAAAGGHSLELDRLCRSKALERYASLNTGENEYILSINLDPAALAEGSGSNHLMESVEKYGLPPGRVLIELTESNSCGMDLLETFVTAYRSRGFLIALDDVGSGYSSLERISVVKPDVLKIDCALTGKINSGYHSREMFKALVSLAHKTGSLVVAEGVETEDQVLSALELGADMLQGFYFAQAADDIVAVKGAVEEKIAGIGLTSRKNIVNKINTRKAQHKSYSQIINDFVAELSKVDEELFDPTLHALVKRYPELECAYVLDSDGQQASATVFPEGRQTSPQGFFFQPAQKGADQSSKDYFFLVASGLLKYTTEPYISLASRHICITISVAFRDHKYLKRILCLDIVQDESQALRGPG